MIVTAAISEAYNTTYTNGRVKTLDFPSIAVGCHYNVHDEELLSLIAFTTSQSVPVNEKMSEVSYQYCNAHPLASHGRNDAVEYPVRCRSVTTVGS